MNIPTVGSTVRVQTRWGKYEGLVIPNERWDSPGSFCLTGDRYIRSRNILPQNVLELEVISGSIQKLDTDSRAWRVKSKSNTYVVTRVANKWNCDCVGFKYHRNCRHIKAVAAKV